MTKRFWTTALMAAAALTACEAQAPREPASETNAAEANVAEANRAGPTTDSASDTPLAKVAGDAGLQWGPCAPFFPAGCEVAVLHGDPAKPNADVFLRVPAGYSIPPHSHSSAERMVLVSGKLQVKYRGHPEATLEPGSYAYGPAKMPHRGTCAAGAGCTLFIAFEGPVDAEPFEGEI